MAPHTVQGIEHVGGVSESDRYLLCLRHLLGKPVYRDPASLLPRTVFAARSEPVVEPLNLVCPSSRAQMLEDLKRREEVFVESKDAAFLYPARYITQKIYPHGADVQWKNLIIEQKAENYGVPGTRNLSPSELKRVARSVFRDARPVPLLAPKYGSNDVDEQGTATIEYPLFVGALRLGPGRPETVVGILGQRQFVGRLVYGEIRDGKYRALWDSPLLHTWMLEMGFRDMDGDGIMEILVKAAHGAKADGVRFSVFTADGREITRQPGCEFSELWGYKDEASVTCPITAEDIELVAQDGDGDPQKGRRDILVRGRIEDLLDPKAYRQLHRYSLRDDRYVDTGVMEEEGQPPLEEEELE